MNLVVLAIMFAATAARSELMGLGGDGRGVTESPVKLTVPAEYLALAVVIRSSGPELENKLADIQQMRQALGEAVAKEPGWKVISRSGMNLAGGYYYLGSLSSGGSKSKTEGIAELLVLAKMEPGADLAQLFRKARQLVEGLHPSKSCRIEVGNSGPAVGNVEDQRPELVRRIKEFVDGQRRILGTEVELELSGLEAPLQVRGSDERTLEVSVPFRVVYRFRPR